jgi:hypothetical protein
MDGIATFTIEMSSSTMNDAVSTLRSAIQRRGSRCSGPAPWAGGGAPLSGGTRCEDGVVGALATSVMLSFPLATTVRFRATTLRRALWQRLRRPVITALELPRTGRI